jgi:hypothetical protein
MVNQITDPAITRTFTTETRTYFSSSSPIAMGRFVGAYPNVESRRVELSLFPPDTSRRRNSSTKVHWSITNIFRRKLSESLIHPVVGKVKTCCPVVIRKLFKHWRYTEL